MDELIKQLTDAMDRNMAIAASIRTEAPEQSFFFWKMSDLMGKAVAALKRNIPQEMETEGGEHTWWNVCPECHGAIDSKDKYCRYCGQAVKP